MKRLQFTFAALTLLLFSTALWSCEKKETPSNSDETPSAQEQAAPPTMAGDMSGMGGTMGMMDQLRAGCPMVVQDTKVTTTDTEGGVTLTFTTDTGDVADLRTRVQHMAQMYEMHHGQGMMWHQMGGKGMGKGDPGMMGGKGMGKGDPGMMGGKGMGQGAGMGMGQGAGMGMGMGKGGPGMGKGMGPGGMADMPAASTTVTDTDLGVQLELRPTDPTQLDALREQVRLHQQRMQSGECWMQQDQPTDTPNGEQE